jgi:hypothetical protein
VWGSGATPNRCTYPHFEKLTPESTLEETWYGSEGLHLIGAPIQYLSTFSKTWWDLVRVI